MINKERNSRLKSILIIILIWLVAMALVYLVIEKFRFLY